MIIAEIKELRPYLVKGITDGLFMEAFKLHNIASHIKWIHIDKLNFEGSLYATSQGWTPETSLLLYVKPPDYDRKHEFSEEALKEELRLEGLSKLNTTQCTCLLFENMTVEKLAGLVNQVVTLKAFL